MAPYNVEWVTFRRDPDGLEALNWWHDRCIEWCYQRAEDGKMGDQKYLDDWLVRFERVHVVRHPGAGLAPWNVKAHRLGEDGWCPSGRRYARSSSTTITRLGCSSPTWRGGWLSPRANFAAPFPAAPCSGQLLSHRRGERGSSGSPISVSWRTPNKTYEQNFRGCGPVSVYGGSGRPLVIFAARFDIAVPASVGRHGNGSLGLSGSRENKTDTGTHGRATMWHGR